MSGGTMRASVVDASSAARDLRVREVPIPTPGPGEVLVAVRAAALDRVDTFMRRGTHGMATDHDVVPGRDLAGIVAQLGPGVEDVSVGDPVVAIGRGAHAEFAVAPVDLTFRIPESWSFLEAAALPTAGRTAYDAVVNKAAVSAGQTVLVTAAGGGVGSSAVQIARSRGARVVATVGSQWKAERARELGADHVVLHGQDHDWAAALREVVDSVDAVIETVGAPMWPGALSLLADDGTIVGCGVSAGHRLDAHLGQLMVRGWRLVGIGRPDWPTIADHIAETFATYGDRGLRPVIDRVLSLDQTAEAHDLLESSAFFGRLMLNPTTTEESP